MWSCPVKSETELKPRVLSPMIHVAYIFGGCQSGVFADRSFKWVAWVQSKHSNSDWFFCFLF